jgi:hypothetical protein
LRIRPARGSPLFAALLGRDEQAALRENPTPTRKAPRAAKPDLLANSRLNFQFKLRAGPAVVNTWRRAARIRFHSSVILRSIPEKACVFGLHLFLSFCTATMAEAAAGRLQPHSEESLDKKYARVLG